MIETVKHLLIGLAVGMAMIVIHQFFNRQSISCHAVRVGDKVAHKLVVGERITFHRPSKCPFQKENND